jgi:alpha-glucosidase
VIAVHPIRFFSMSLLCALPLVCVKAQAPVAPPQAMVHTASGAEFSNAAMTIRVDALKPDVLRVRLYPEGHPAEDASWAVLPQARTARVVVQPTSDGFTTAALIVSIGPDLRLVVSDRDGHVVQSDAAPVSWNGTEFRVSKNKFTNDHFFGLGDKPGPLDRAGESFVMWNNDSFGWQESTDLQIDSVLSRNARWPYAWCSV